MGDQRTYYVYIIFRLDGSPCYVGKGKGKRLNSHFSRKSHNRYLDRIIKKEGRKLPIVKIRQNLTEYEALHIERSFISAIGKIREGGTLVNFTDGGEGISGFRFSSKSKNKMRVAKLGKTLTAEHKSNISNSLSGIFVWTKAHIGSKTKDA